MMARIYACNILMRHRNAVRDGLDTHTDHASLTLGIELRDQRHDGPESVRQ